jgi:hypothetical protein
MMPFHPNGALVSNSEPVGAAGYRLLVVLSMRRFSPARGSAGAGSSLNYGLTVQATTGATRRDLERVADSILRDWPPPKS